MYWDSLQPNELSHKLDESPTNANRISPFG